MTRLIKNRNYFCLASVREGESSISVVFDITKCWKIGAAQAPNLRTIYAELVRSLGQAFVTNVRILSVANCLLEESATRGGAFRAPQFSAPLRGRWRVWARGCIGRGRLHRSWCTVRRNVSLVDHGERRSAASCQQGHYKTSRDEYRTARSHLSISFVSLVSLCAVQCNAMALGCTLYIGKLPAGL